jgi:hypothetical protein
LPLGQAPAMAAAPSSTPAGPELASTAARPSSPHPRAGALACAGRPPPTSVSGCYSGDARLHGADAAAAGTTSTGAPLPHSPLEPAEAAPRPCAEDPPPAPDAVPAQSGSTAGAEPAGSVQSRQGARSGVTPPSPPPSTPLEVAAAVAITAAASKRAEAAGPGAGTSAVRGEAAPLPTSLVELTPSSTELTPPPMPPPPPGAVAVSRLMEDE